MKKTLSLIMLVGLTLTMQAQTAREEIAKNPYLSGSNYLDYDRQLPSKKLHPERLRALLHVTLRPSRFALAHQQA